MCLYIFSLDSVAASAETRIPEFFFYIFYDYRNLIYIVLLPLVALIPDFMHKFVKQNFCLEDTDIIEKIENKK
jgi:hypothetical protein